LVKISHLTLNVQKAEVVSAATSPDLTRVSPGERGRVKGKRGKKDNANRSQAPKFINGEEKT